jgi:hypothetical protein
MRRPLWTAGLPLIGALLAITSPSASAQDFPTDQLERHADVVRQDNLLRSTLQSSPRKISPGVATAQQQAACRRKTQFRRQYGADHPKVRKLYALCLSVGL